jgi:hypothetical protein
MPNALQTCPYLFSHISKNKVFQMNMFLYIWISFGLMFENQNKCLIKNNVNLKFNLFVIVL